MIFDAHVHMGYWMSNGVLRYYSPRRIFSVLNRCGVDRFIVSSTSTQAGVISVRDLVREAREMRRVAKGRAYVYCWISDDLYRMDENLEMLSDGVYSGIKLHEMDVAWNKYRRDDLRKILNVAARKRMNVMLHSGEYPGCSPGELEWMAREYPAIKFNFAHCRPADEMLRVLERNRNVYTDVAYMNVDEIAHVLQMDKSHRIMFGSDIPALHIDDRNGMTYSYRKTVAKVIRMQCADSLNEAFANFCKR